MEKKVLFFDLDRTLWDFEANSSETLQELAIHHDLKGKGIESFDHFLSHYHRINDHLWAEYRAGNIQKEGLRLERFRRAFLEVGIDDPAFSGAFGEDYIRLSPRKTNLVPDTLNVLRTLQERGYSMHIITNGFEEVQQLKMNSCGLHPYFGETITSERAGFLKPHRGIFDFALTLTGTKVEDAVMIGDSLDADILGAREAGWQQVYFNPQQEAHGETVSHEIWQLIQLLDILK